MSEAQVCGRALESTLRKKTGLVGPVSYGAELDAVTSQTAQLAGGGSLVGLEPVRSPGCYLVPVHRLSVQAKDYENRGNRRCQEVQTAYQIKMTAILQEVLLMHCKHAAWEVAPESPQTGDTSTA